MWAPSPRCVKCQHVLQKYIVLKSEASKVIQPMLKAPAPLFSDNAAMRGSQTKDPLEKRKKKPELFAESSRIKRLMKPFTGVFAHSEKKSRKAF